MKRYTYNVKDQLDQEMHAHGSCEDCQNLDESIDKNGRPVYFCTYLKRHISRGEFGKACHCYKYDPKLKYGRYY